MVEYKAESCGPVTNIQKLSCDVDIGGNLMEPVRLFIEIEQGNNKILIGMDVLLSIWDSLDSKLLPEHPLKSRKEIKMAPIDESEKAVKEGKKKAPKGKWLSICRMVIEHREGQQEKAVLQQHSSSKDIRYLYGPAAAGISLPRPLGELHKGLEHLL